MPLLAPYPPEAPRLRAYETDCSSCTVRTSEKGGVQNCVPKSLVGPVSDDVAARSSFLRLEPMARSGKTDRYFLCRGGPAVARCRRVWGATAMLCGARDGAPSRAERHQHAPSALSPAKQPLARASSTFSESELISAQPATRQATDPICHLHNPAMNTQTPGAGRASHVMR